MKLNFHLTILATIVLLTPIWLVTDVNAEIKILQPELIVQKTRFRTPDIREPSGIIKRRRTEPFPKSRPTALIPETNIGLTLDEYPTFFVYLPAMVGKRAEFWLTTEDGDIVYETTFTLLDSNGIISVNLPDDDITPPLAVGKKYQWSVAIILDPRLSYEF